MSRHLSNAPTEVTLNNALNPPVALVELLSHHQCETH